MGSLSHHPLSRVSLVLVKRGGVCMDYSGISSSFGGVQQNMGGTYEAIP